MVNVVEHNTKNTTIEFVTLLGTIVVFITVLSVTIVSYLVHNPYAAGYYTIASLFDAVGVDEGTAFYAIVPNFSGQFYLLVAVSILDGVVKIVLVGFVMAAMVDTIAAIGAHPRLHSFGRRSMRGHFIICGYSKLAEKVMLELKERHTPFIVIEREQAKFDMAREAGFGAVREDFTTTQALRDASIDSAKGIMFLTENDYENLLGVVTARHLNKSIKIIAKAEETNAITKIHRAGAELCVVPEVLAGLEVGETIIGR